MWQEFKEFISKGNLVELAVAVILALAFAGLVTSFTENLINPIIGAIFGQPNFDALVLTVNGAQIRYGSFLTALVSFLLLALTIMLIVQAIRRATGRETAGAQGNRECDHCKSFIPVDASVCMFCTRDVDPVVT